MTEIYFNDLTVRVGMATVGVKVTGLVLETVAVPTLVRLGMATVADGINDSAAGFLDTLAVRFNDSTTRQHWYCCCWTSVLESISIHGLELIDLYVHWKPGFMLNLEASLLSILSVVRDDKLWSTDSITQRQQLGLNVGFLDTSTVRFNGSVTR